MENKSEYYKVNKVKFWHKWLYRTASRKRHNKKKIEVSINEDWILQKYQEQSGRCFWTGVELEITHIPNHPLKPSLDRIDPRGAYSRENTVITALSINIGRNENSEKDWKEFIHNYLKL